jgi:hypothetical protein
MFFTAYEHWLEAGDKADLATISESVMSLLATIAPTSTASPSSRQRDARVRANQSVPSPRRGRGSHDPGVVIEGQLTGRPR